MELSKAFSKAIRAYMKGGDVYKEYNSNSKKKFKYTKEYFERIEDELNIPSSKKKKDEEGD